MKAIVAVRAGGPDVLEHIDVPTPSPAVGQVLVRAGDRVMLATPFARIDLVEAAAPPLQGLRVTKGRRA